MIMIVQDAARIQPQAQLILEHELIATELDYLQNWAQVSLPLFSYFLLLGKVLLQKLIKVENFLH